MRAILARGQPVHVSLTHLFNRPLTSKVKIAALGCSETAMAMPTTKVILFNAAASLVAIGAVVGVVRTWFAPTALRACSERYETSMVFPLERDGAMLTATDIQARTGGKDAGLLENLSVG